MEQAADFDHEFSCPVCLDLLNDPLTIPCGHSYCRDCIDGCWDQEDHVGVYSCPQCRQSFIPRPVLGRNTMLAEVVEKLKKAELQASSPDQCGTGPGDVMCDVCTEKKNKAVKSCLLCLASYCESHLKVHNELNPGKRHKLTDATTKLEHKICSHHDKLLEVYCRTDQQCLCLLCVMDKHRAHDTVSAAAERTEKQKQLGAAQWEFQQRIEQKEEKLEELREAMDSIIRSAQAAVDHTDRIFTEMIRSIEEKRSELKDKIRAQEEAAVRQAEDLLERLKKEIAELKKKSSDLEELMNTEDHIHFLQNFRSLCVPPGTEDVPNITATPTRCCFVDAKKAVSDLKIQLEETCKEAFTGIHQMAKEVLQNPEPKSREEFLHYACQLALDPDTANRYLYLSEENTAVTWKEIKQSCPDHPERFQYYLQVLCTEALSGRCYWEVQWSGNSGVCIAVSYKSISRKGGGNDCGLGHNEKSWSLFCSPPSYSFWHNDKDTVVSGPISSTIGVYLDHRAGTLSFYSISDTMNLIHRVHTTFTEPLYPGFWVGLSSKAKLSSLIQ